MIVGGSAGRSARLADTARRRSGVRPALVRLGIVLSAIAALAGCSRQSSGPAATPPAVLEPVPGTALRKVVLSESAFDALQVRTETAQASPGGLVIPTTAVIYSPDGAAWTYVMLGPRTYMRHAIVVERTTGIKAFLRSGPAAGTPVVTVGAPELLGTEYRVGEE
jgi:multidrug efflux pump subunit AcrA (membrane-fusion protein)